MNSNTSRVGTSNQDQPHIKAPKMMDHSGTKKVASGGANIHKVVPGLNNSIIPLTADPRR